jgi:hypothetical protein
MLCLIVRADGEFSVKSGRFPIVELPNIVNGDGHTIEIADRATTEPARWATSASDYLDAMRRYREAEATRLAAIRAAVAADRELRQARDALQWVEWELRFAERCAAEEQAGNG